MDGVLDASKKLLIYSLIHDVGDIVVYFRNQVSLFFVVLPEFSPISGTRIISAWGNAERAGAWREGLRMHRMEIL